MGVKTSDIANMIETFTEEMEQHSAESWLEAALATFSQRTIIDAHRAYLFHTSLYQSACVAFLQDPTAAHAKDMIRRTEEVNETYTRWRSIQTAAACKRATANTLACIRSIKPEFDDA